MPLAERDGDLTLERVAVGEHILLGGDNMDLALAHRVEPEHPDAPGLFSMAGEAPTRTLLHDAGFDDVRTAYVPVTFPATDFHEGHMLSGLGVPDVSGRIGKPFYFTSELDFKRDGSNEFSIEVVQLEDNRGVINTKIQGPPNKLFEGGPEYIEIPITFTVAEATS